MAVTDKNREKFEANKRRINLYLPFAIADALDLQAEALGCNRTEMLIHILLAYFEQQKAYKLSEVAEKLDIDRK